jgi:hypothetical protein
VQLRRSPSARAADADWHKSRQEAREVAYSSDLDTFFSEEEIVKYNLDTARVTGRENPRLYIFRRTLDVFGINGTDIRELRNR